MEQFDPDGGQRESMLQNTRSDSIKSNQSIGDTQTRRADTESFQLRTRLMLLQAQRQEEEARLHAELARLNTIYVQREAELRFASEDFGTRGSNVAPAEGNCPMPLEQPQFKTPQENFVTDQVQFEKHDFSCSNGPLSDSDRISGSYPNQQLIQEGFWQEPSNRRSDNRRGFEGARKQPVPMPRSGISPRIDPATTNDVLSLIASMREESNISNTDTVTFNGDPKEYFAFMRFFNSKVGRRRISSQDKLLQLIKMCVGPAYESVKNYVIYDNHDYAFQAAMQKLEDRFGRQDIIVESVVRELVEGPPIPSGDVAAFQNFADKVHNCTLILNAWNRIEAIGGYEYLERIFTRLPPALQDTYVRKAGTEPPSYHHLADFIQFQAHQQNTFWSRAKARFARECNMPQPIPRKRVSRIATFAVQNETDISKYPCMDCNSDHPVHRCNEFRSWSSESRRKFVDSHRLCWNCLRSHFASDCTSQSRCRQCHGKHHTLLCDSFSSNARNKLMFNQRPIPRPRHLARPGGKELGSSKKLTDVSNSSNGAGNRGSSVFASLQSNDNCSKLRLQVVPVKVSPVGTRRSMWCYAFLDQGATRSLCTKDLLRKLGISSGEPETSVFTTLGHHDIHNGYRVDLRVQGRGVSHEYQLNDVFALDALPDVRDSIPDTGAVKFHPHLDGLDFTPLQCQDIHMLIAGDVLYQDPVEDVRLGSPGTPTAYKTIFGWTLFGPDETKISAGHRDSVNFVAISPLTLDNGTICSSCGHEGEKNPFQTELSLDDQRALDTLEASVTKLGDRLQIGMPWKDESTTFPNNYPLAFKRLMSLRKRFNRDPVLKEKYTAKVNELLDNQYAEIVPECELAVTPLVNFLPHHSTGQKFRMVFDCSADFEGTSLNKKLLSGPNLNNNILGVLMRFREHPVAFTADIKQMFLRILVPPVDRDKMRFLWFNDDLTQTVQMRMRSHVFGATSSPCVAAYALKSVARNNLSGASESTRNVINQSFYVDDCLHSVTSVSEARVVISELISLLNSGGFELTKFASNKEAALEGLPNEKRASLMRLLPLEDSPTQRTLGISWNTVNDCFEVTVRVTNQPRTRRGMLSQVGQVFDPLGFLQPFLLPAKRILQDLCHLGYGWDTRVPDSYRQKWDEWVGSLYKLNELVLQRCYKTDQFETSRIELHCFCDSSEIGYGAVVYLRQLNTRGESEIQFVRGSSRVTPKRFVTIPRLELMAAVLAIELVKGVHSELSLTIDQTYYWSDSMTVIRIINNSSTRFKTFIANRLAIIRSSSKPSQWQYVESEQNSADLASRGILPNDIDKSSMWVDGPDFLRKMVGPWPDRSLFEGDVELHPALEREVKINAITCDDNISKHASLYDLICHYSTFERVRRAFGWMLRFKAYLMHKWKNTPSFQSGPLSVDELDEANINICKLVQKRHFSNVINVLKIESNNASKCINVKAFPEVFRLNPFLDNGILRVGGRLMHSRLSRDKRHPIILPADDHFTELIIDFYHRRDGHCGTAQVLAAVRQIYWVMRGQAVARRVIRRCRFCCKYTATLGTQMMAPLPIHRVQPTRPFQHVMIDYFGPIKTHLGRKIYKRWVLIATCLSTRACHLEVAESLDTSAFLEAFFRICDRRGRPSHCYSDNGTNFIGGQRLLADGIKNLNQSKIYNRLSEQEIRWHFSPPASSHRNGVVERMVRSAKTIMRSLVCSKSLTDFSLITAMTGVERILNDRPLTPLTDDADDLNALTPNSILLINLEPGLPPDKFMKRDEYRQSWRSVQYLLNLFWDRWLKEYLPLLQRRQKWLFPNRNFNVGDLVLVRDVNSPRGLWPKARVIEVISGSDGLVRTAKVRTATSELIRDIRNLCLLEAV